MNPASDTSPHSTLTPITPNESNKHSLYLLQEQLNANQVPAHCWTHGITSKGDEHTSVTYKLRFKIPGLHGLISKGGDKLHFKNSGHPTSTTTINRMYCADCFTKHQSSAQHRRLHSHFSLTFR
jgi:hypothetical protein